MKNIHQEVKVYEGYSHLWLDSFQIVDKKYL